MAKTPVCPHCGSKETVDNESFYTCNACHNDFGREALSDDGESMITAVKGMRFRYGDVISGSVRLRFVQDGDVCLYEVYDSYEGGVNKFAGVLEGKEWTKLKKTLFESLYLMDWDREYIPVNDGREIRGNNEWEFAVAVSMDEEYVYRGVDADPAYWNKFMKLIEPFFDEHKKEED